MSSTMRSISAAGQRLEQHDVVEPVEELGPEVAAQLGHDALARVGLDLAARGDVRRAGTREPMLEVMMMTVLRKSTVRPCASVSRPSSRTCSRVLNTSGVRLLDLVEQHHRVRLAAHRLGELAAFLVADVARRRADQAADGVPLLVLAHVDPDHVVLGVEQGGGQRLGQLRLAHAGGAEEDERPDRAPRVLDARPGPDDGVGDQLHGLVLADDPLVQDLVEAQQLLPLALLQAGDRDAGPAGHDRRRSPRR